MLARLLAINAGWNLLSHLMSRGILMAAAIYLSRSFDVKEFASYSYFNLTVSMLTAFSSLGLGVGASKYFAELNARNLSDNFQRASGLWLISIFISSLVAILIAMLPIELIGAGMDLPLWMYSMGVFLTFQAIVPSGAMLGLERYRSTVVIAIVYSVVIIASSYFSVIFKSILISVFGIMAAILVQAILESVVVIRYVGWHKLTSSMKLNFNIFKDLISFSGPMMLVSLIAASGTWVLGRFILMAADGVYNFAIYTIGLQWYALGLLLPGVISKVMLPRLINNNLLNSESNESRKMVKYGIFLSIGASLVVATFGAIAGPWLIDLYGARYNSDRWYISAYLFAAVFNSPANAIGNALIASNKQKTWGILLFIWLLILIFIGNLSFVGGSFTGAIALAVAACVLSCTSFFVAKQENLV